MAVLSDDVVPSNEVVPSGQAVALGEAAAADLTPTQRNPRLRLLIPLIVASGFFMEQLDSTIITTAIPDMAGEPA